MSVSKQTCHRHDVPPSKDVHHCPACGEVVIDRFSDKCTPSDEPLSRHGYKMLDYKLGQEIRLLELYPARDDEHFTCDDLTCDIVHFNLKDKPQYEALSYTWADELGDNSLSRSIFTRETGQAIAITKNCEAALYYLRLKKRKRLLWIDAICIDQENVSERNHQVNFMGIIYSSASQVLMFLGHGSKATDKVMDHLNGTSSADIWNEDDTQRDDVKEFLSRRYFDRVWILQEIALSKFNYMVVGNKRAHWTPSSTDALQKLIPSSEPFRVPSALRWHRASVPEHDLLGVLLKSRNCSASDPRDKVYAVLGLVQEDMKTKISVDYSLSLDEVYQSAARHIIVEQNQMDVLKYASNNWWTWKPHKLPSWVPQWDNRVEYDPLPAQFTLSEIAKMSEDWHVSRKVFHNDQFLAVQNGISWHSDDSNYGKLSSGGRIDRVLSKAGRYDGVRPQLTDPGMDSMSLDHSYKRDREFHHAIVVDSVLRVRAYYLDTIWRTISNSVFSSWPARRAHLNKLKYTNYSKSGNLWYGSQKFDHDERALRRSLAGRADYDRMTCFLTRSSMGVAPSDKVRTGDSIWAIVGADVPFALRRIDNHYILVSECHYTRPPRVPTVTRIVDIW